MSLMAWPSLAQSPQSGLTSDTPPANAIWLESLDLTKMSQDYGTPAARHTVDGNPLRLKGVEYPHGVGTHARSEFRILLNGAATRFTSMVGLDDERTGQGSIVFQVWVDGKMAAISPELHGGDAPRFIDVDLKGAKRLMLIVGDAGDGIENDHADWAGASITLKPGAAKPVAYAQLMKPAPMPKIASGVSHSPEIHGAPVAGTTPGHAFLFLVPATGDGPLTYSATGLPGGLSIDSSTGIISGTVASAGVTDAVIMVHGRRGTTKRGLRIVAGDHKLAQTPPMGWNSWNVWAGAVDDAKVRAAADWMVKSGLAAHGFQYINIDDTWEAARAADGEIRTNEKFPDMKALADYVHSKGLKLGIYSSPGPTTCAGFPASYQHEVQDAQTYAKWGIDYLKYDWCSYGDVATGDGLYKFQKPYIVMRQALDTANRDIVYSLCQYGMGDVWNWGAEIGGNCWRTTGDINDSWRSLDGIAFSQNGHELGASPGHWNDPDMLVVGKVGWGPSIHPTHLTPDEQILHISMWCLQSAPLLLGCDLSQLDKFTLDLMTNDEVLAINQDALGKPAARAAKNGLMEVWARPLADGSMAVGLFNRSDEPANVTANWSDLKVYGSQKVRNLWQRRDLGTYEDSFTTRVAAHGAVLVKVAPAE
jgi:alpha-galactosidase